MGIDIYAEWRDKSQYERRAQSEAWLSTTDGDIGYLREAYHGEPYATRYFCPEAFESGEARIPAATLRERLPETLRLAEIRERTIYHSTNPEIEAVKESYRAFVTLCEAKEKETGESVLIIASY